jgi:hypothetical protein
MVGAVPDFSRFVRCVDLERVQLSFFTDKAGLRADRGTERGRWSQLVSHCPRGSQLHPRAIIRDVAKPSGNASPGSASSLAKSVWETT